MQETFLVLALFFSFTSSIAQEQKPNYDSLIPKRFISEFELYVGPALSTVRGWKLEGTNIQKKTQVRYSIGLGVSHRLTKRMKIKSNVFLERKSIVAEIPVKYFNNETETVQDEQLTEDYSLYYYTFALMPCYTTSRFEIGLGPYGSYLQKSELKQTYSFSPGKPQVQDMADFYNHFDFGVVAWAGYHIPLNSNIDVTFQLSNTLGLTDIVRQSTEGWSTKMNNTSLLFGFTFKR